MSNNASELKDKGNDEFKAGIFLKAAALYSQAIKLEPSNAVLYSNRSAALLKLKKVTKALEDADKCISLKPDWDKGFFRRGSVLEETEKYAEALEAYQKSFSLNANNPEVSKKIKTLSRLVKVQVKQASEDTLENFIQNSLGQGKVSDFAKDIFNHVVEAIQKDGVNINPTLHFVPGDKAEKHDVSEENVRATHAYNMPDNYGKFVTEMRALSEKLDAQAACSVVSKAVIAYPQRWLQPGWPCGKQAGVFVQLETQAAKKCWFVPVYEKVPGKPVSVDIKFGPMDNLIR